MRAKVFYILFFLPFAALCQCAPGNVSNLFMWLKADNNVFGSPISGWGDSSPNGRNLNTSGANAPTSVSAGLNYNPLIRFDGTNDYFNRPGGILPVSTMKDFYVYFVTRTNSIATDQYLYAENSAGGSSPRIAGIVPASNGLMYQDFGDNVNGRLWVNWPGIGNTSDYILWSLNTSTTISTPSGANKAIYKNGTLVSNSVAQTMVTGNNSTFYLGSMDGASGFFNGDLAEFIVFNGIPSTVEQRKIHSYLAAKYGITLAQGTPQDYLASDGTTLMWTSAKAVNLYNNNIAVLGRDDNSCLNQKQSKGWGDILTIGLNTIAGTNALNTSSVPNFTFQSWGNDNGSLSLQNSDMPAGSGFVNRVVREWKIQETGTVAQTMIAFDLSTTSILGNNASDFGLLIDLDGDGDFTTGSVTSFAATSYVNNKVYFANVNFSDQQVFTIATRISGPGGIISGLKLWLKSDAGVYSNLAGTIPAAHGSAIKYWKDFSPILNNATSAGTVDPVYQSIGGQINYNPTVLFTNNISSYLNIDLNSIKNSDYTLFGTSLRNGINNENYFLGIQCFIIDKCLSLGYRVDNTITLDQFGDKIELGVTSWNNPYSPSILSGGLDQSSGLFVSEQRQGVYTYGLDNTKTTPLLTGTDQGVVGRGYNITGFLGNISEIIVYNRKLSAIENQKINSYLAIKNGVTLSQSTPTNYISSTGNVIWNAVSAGAYKYDIAAIGRDDNSSLNQKQSIAFSTGDIVSIGLGTVAGSNSSNPNTFSSDQSFVSWSNNHDVFTEQTTDLPAGSAYSSRISREWKVQTTGTVGSTQLSFDLSGMGIATATASNLSLIIDLDGDGDFTTGSLTSITANSLSSNILKFNNVNLPNGSVFTIARNLGVGPGGITSGLNLWLKANSGVYSDISGTIPAVDGVGIKYWKDFSSTLNNAISTGTIDPVFQSTGGQINYNPTVFFNNPPDQYFNISLNSIMNSDYTLFGSFLRNSTVPNNYFLGTQANILDNGLHFGYRTDNVVTLAQYNDDINQNVPSYNMPYSPAIIVGKLDQSTGKSIAEYRNNVYNSSSNTITTPLTGNAQGVVGRGYTAEGFSGNLTEILVYNRALTALETQKITSYLAIKNGVTIDQSTPTDYISSQGNIIWNSGIVGAYKYDIAVIGRDDKSSLNQKQSIAFNTGDLVTIGLGTISGTNSANPNSFSSDLSFISWSNNHGALSEQTTEIPTISSITKRLGREWKVQKVGTVGSVQVNVDLTSYTFSGTSFADFSLLVDSDGDGDFTTGTIQTLSASTLTGNVVTFSNVNFNNGDVFTISTFKSAPGGVRSGLNLWLKATSGIFSNSSGTIPAVNGSGVQYWYDYSLNQNHAIKGGASDPIYRLSTNLINYNPTVLFNNSTNQYFSVNFSSLMNNNYTLFGALMRSSNNSENYFLGTQSNTPNQALHIGYRNDTDVTLDQYSNNVDQAVTSYSSPLSPAILIGTSDLSSGKTISEYRNSGLATMNSANIQALTGTAPGVVGRGYGTNGFLGDLTEVMAYNRKLSSLEIQKVNSYLSIKNGISISQSTPTNYIASNGTTIWSAAIAGTYNNDIAGIGRDDASGLNQKQSKSVNSDEIISIGLGTIASSNLGNANSFGSDLTFQIWANDNGALLEQTTEIPTTTGCLKRLGREWKVKQTGTVGNCQLTLDLSSLTVTGSSLNDFNLFIDQDGDGNFTTGAITVIGASTLSGNVVTFNNVNFNDGNVFTFTTSSVSSISMGGIITSPSLLQCISGNSGTLTLTGYNGSILNWESSTDNFATTQTITNTAFTNAFNNLTANTSFRARVQNSVCPSTTSGIITLTTVGISLGGSVSGINSPYCTGSNTGTLTLSGYVGNILLWQSSANNFSTVSTISNTAFNQSFNNLTTNTGYRAVIQNSVCPSTTSGIFTVSVVGVSVGGTISGSNISQCTGANTGTLTLSGFNGNIQKWQSSPDNFATIFDIASTTAFVGFNNLTTTTSYRAIVQNGLCSTVSSSAFTITVNGISVGGTVAGTNLPVCASSNAGTLTLSGYVGTIQKWQSSSDNFISVTNISSITSTIGYSNLTTTTSFRAIVQNGQCSTVSSLAFTITVNGISIGGTVTGPNLSQCSGANSGTLTLSGFTGSIQNWQTSTDNFATVVSISSITSFIAYSNLTTTTSFRSIVQNGACSTVSSGAFTVTVNGISVGGTITGPNTPVCALSNLGTLTLAGFTGSIINWQSSSDNFATITTISSTTSSIGFSNLSTTSSFKAIVQNGACSTVSSNAFTVTVNGVSIGGTVTGPNLSQCSGTNSGTLTLSGFTGSIQNWLSSTDNFATAASISSITSFIAYSNLTTTTSFRSIVQNGSCSTVPSSIFTVTVNGISVGGTITGPNTPVCASSNLGTLTLAGFTGSIINWQSSSDNFATITTVSSTTSSIGFSNLSITSSFKATVQNGACATVSSNAFTVTVNGVSIGGTVSGSSIVQCAGANSGTITLTSFTGNILGWQSSSDNFSTLTTIGSTTSTLSYSNLTTTTSFRAIIQNGACSTVSSAAFTVTINGLSLGGSVSGTNISQCAGSNSGTLTLSGYSGSIQNWQSSTDNFATISSISSTTAFLGFANLTTTTSYRAIIQNGACSTVASSSFTITVNGVSIGGSISGPTLPVCSGSNNGTLTLSGFSGNIKNWQTSIDNFTTVTNVSSITSSLTFLNISTSTSYRAIVQNGICATISSSAFTVTVNGISTGGTVSGNSVPYCASLNSGILTVSGFIGSVQYWQSSTDNFATLANISSATSTFGFNNLSTTTSFRAIVQNGSCSTVASTSFTVTINGLSIGGNAVGPSSSQCLGSNSGTVSIAGLVGNVLAWEMSVDNFATSSPIASTTSFINFSNLTSSTGFRATVQNGVCSSTSSIAFTVTVGGVSVGGSINGPSASLCTGSNGTLTLTGFIGNVLGWQSSTDNFASIIAISSTTSTLPFVNLTTTTSYRALVQNGACASSTSASFTVSVNGISVGGSVVGPSSPVCSSANSGTLTLSGYAGSILNWQSSTDNFTTFSPIASTSSFLIFSNLITTTSFRAIIQNGGCSSVTSSAFTMTVDGLSVGGSISGPNSSYCSGSNSGTITLSGFVGSILNWESSSDNFTTISPISATATSISFLNLTTTTSYRTVVQNGVCSTTNSASFTITVGGISVGGTVDGPTNLQCSGSNAGTLTLSGFSGNIISWESSTDNFATASTIASTNATLNYSNVTTNTGFRAIIQNGACSTTTSASFVVSVSGVSIGGTITGPITSQCANANLFNLTLSGFIGSILNWESSTDNFSTVVSIVSTTSNISLSNLLTTTSFRAIVQNGACSTTISSIFVASIDGIAIGGNVSGPTGILCAGSNLGDLTVSGFNGSIVNWESSTDNFLTSNFIASTTSTFTFANLVSTTGFRANIQNGSCPAISSSPYTVTISGISVGGSIDGPVSSQCSGSNLGDLTLTGFNGSIVNWESSTDNFVTSSVIASTSPTITFTNLSTTTSYRANVQSGTCTPVSSSSFTISVNGAAFGGAISGLNTILCGSVNSGTLTLSGYAGTISNWESSTDNFNTTQPISNTTQYLTFNNLTTTTSFRATISNGSCPTLSSGLFTITISSPSFGGSIFASTNTVCSATNSGTISISGYVGSVLNWESSLDNFTSSTTLSNTSDFYSFSNLTTTTSFRAIVQSGSCTSTISGITTVLVVPNSASGTIAGPASSFCSGSNSGTLTLSGFVGSILNWQSSIDNFASSTIINQTSSTLGFNNLSQSTSFRAVVQNGNCSVSISSPFAISLSSGSAGTVSGPLSPLCITNASGTLTLSGFTAPVNRWEYTIDNSTFIPIPNSSSSYSFTQLTTTTSFRAIVQSGSCPEVSSNSFTVTVSPLPKSGTITGGTILPLGENAGTIQLTNYYGQITAWEEASDSLMTNPSIINNTSSQQNYTNLTSTKYYRATVSTPGCQAIKSNSAGIVIQLLIIYTGFSPDGDGKNDTWVIENIQLYPNNQVKIYNRWGNLVYQESGYDNSTKVWKGNSNTGFVIGGDALPEGTYYYIISINGKSDLSGYLLLNK